MQVYLFQCLLPAVGLVAERALELFHQAVPAPVTAPAIPRRPSPAAAVHVALAHLLLEVLLEAGLVGKLAGTVGALQGAVGSVVGRLQVVVEEPLLRKVFITVVANEGTFAGVDPKAETYEL